MAEKSVRGGTYAEIIGKQLCWDCSNACGGCPWSDELKPVPGWIADSTVINGRGGRDDRNYPFDSYLIRYCPMFVPDSQYHGTQRLKPAKPVQDVSGAGELLIAIYRQAARDYQKAVKYYDLEAQEKVLDFLKHHPKKGFIELMETVKVCNNTNRMGGIFSGDYEIGRNGRRREPDDWD